MQGEIGSNARKELEEKEDRRVSLGRHQAQCTICLSPYREEIEEAWTNWCGTFTLGKQFGVSRDAIYRHAHAFGLFRVRRINVRGALEQILERIDQTPMKGSDILGAIKLLSKMDSDEEEKESRRDMDFKRLLGRMSPEERVAFAHDGSLPQWLSKATDQTRQGRPRALPSSGQLGQAGAADAAGETNDGVAGAEVPGELREPVQQNAIVVFTDESPGDS